MIARSVEAFLSRADVGCVVLATNQREQIEPALRGPGAGAMDPRVMFCTGGAARAASVWAALRAVPERFEWVAVHDAARPLVSQALIDATLDAARRRGAAAAPAMPVSLTIRQATGPLPARAGRSLPRHTLWAMQTPQVARRADLLAACEACPIPLDEVTDDLQLLELAGREVWLVAGEERNLKITTGADLQLAELLLQSRD